MSSVWGELKRRNVVKVAVAYAIVGWLLVQVADTFFPALQLPDWTVTFVAALVIFGFPLALILSWAYELTPDGMQRSNEASATEISTNVAGRKREVAIIGALVLAFGFAIYSYFLVDRSGEGVEEVSILPNSVAVLVCDNLSPDPNDAYFAEGVHEEILNQLVKIRALNVIARTSVLQYADAPPAIPQIAEELNVGAVMECSVRHAGDSILVTAQLIDPVTNSHMWSQTYPGSLSDLSAVFAMQADIAMNIANALEVEFSLAEQAQIERQKTVSAQAYELYLQARAEHRPERLQYLDAAIALDPDFALAHATKAFTVASVLYYGGLYNDSLAMSRDDAEAEVLETASYALSLDENLGPAYSARALIHEMNWRWAEAEAAHERALEIDSQDPLTLQRFASFRRRTGEYAESVRLTELVIPLDPLNSTTYHHVGIAHMYARSHAEAVPLFDRALSMNSRSALSLFGKSISLNALGLTDEALESLQRFEQVSNPNAQTNLALLAMGYAKAGQPELSSQFLRELESLSEERNIGSGNLALAYLAIGDETSALQRFAQAIEERSLVDRIVLSHLKANIWSDPILDRDDFQQLRDSVTPLGFQ